MHVRQFEHETDKLQIDAWLAKHGLVSVPGSELPTLGFIVDDVAAGFLRACEGSYALFDGLVTNPEQPAEIRHQALDYIFSSILAAAQGRTVLGFTTDAGTHVRAQSRGFKPLPHALLAFKG